MFAQELPITRSGISGSLAGKKSLFACNQREPLLVSGPKLGKWISESKLAPSVQMEVFEHQTVYFSASDTIIVCQQNRK